MKKHTLLFALILILMLPATGSLADEFYCEVMTLEGTATLSNAEITTRPLK